MIADEKKKKYRKPGGNFELFLSDRINPENIINNDRKRNGGI